MNGGGILDWLRTPEGVGVLGAVGGYAANAQRGAPINSAGRGLLAGTLAYTQGLDRQERQAENAQQAQFRNLQMDASRVALEKARRESANEQGLTSLYPQFFSPGAPAVGQIDSAMPPELRTGAVPMPAQAPKFDVQGFTAAALNKGYIDPVKALQLQQAAEKDNAPITLAPGASLYDRKTLKPLATAPKEQELPSAVREYEFARTQGYSGNFEQWVNTQNTAKAPKVAVDLRDPTAVAKVGLDIQDKVRSAFKQDNVIASQYRAMQTAVANPSPQGDTALLYSFFKVLDPESTVREGEIDMVKASRSIPDQFKGYAQRLAGGGTLLPSERQDLLNQAARQVQGRIPRAQSDLKAYRENAGRLNLDPDLYAPDPYAGLKFGEKEKPKANGQAFASMPPANGANKGRFITDQQTGKRFQSDGMRWTEVK